MARARSAELPFVHLSQEVRPSPWVRVGARREMGEELTPSQGAAWAGAGDRRGQVALAAMAGCIGSNRSTERLLPHQSQLSPLCLNWSVIGIGHDLVSSLSSTPLSPTFLPFPGCCSGSFRVLSSPDGHTHPLRRRWAHAQLQVCETLKQVCSPRPTPGPRLPPTSKVSCWRTVTVVMAAAPPGT